MCCVNLWCCVMYWLSWWEVRGERWENFSGSLVCWGSLEFLPVCHDEQCVSEGDCCFSLSSDQRDWSRLSLDVQFLSWYFSWRCLLCHHSSPQFTWPTISQSFILWILKLTTRCWSSDSSAFWNILTIYGWFVVVVVVQWNYLFLLLLWVLEHQFDLVSIVLFCSADSWLMRSCEYSDVHRCGISDSTLFSWSIYCWSILLISLITNSLVIVFLKCIFCWWLLGLSWSPLWSHSLDW